MFWSDSAVLATVGALAFMFAGTVIGLVFRFGRG